MRLQSRVAAQDFRVAEAVETIRRARARTVSRLFLKDSPPIWQVRHAERAGDQLAAGSQESWTAQLTALENYVQRRASAFALHGAILAVLIAAMYWMRRRAVAWAAEDPGLKRTASSSGRAGGNGVRPRFHAEPLDVSPGAPAGVGGDWRGGAGPDGHRAQTPRNAHPAARALCARRLLLRGPGACRSPLRCRSSRASCFWARCWPVRSSRYGSCAVSDQEMRRRRRPLARAASIAQPPSSWGRCSPPLRWRTRSATSRSATFSATPSCAAATSRSSSTPSSRSSTRSRWSLLRVKPLTLLRMVQQHRELLRRRTRLVLNGARPTVVVAIRARPADPARESRRWTEGDTDDRARSGLDQHFSSGRDRFRARGMGVVPRLAVRAVHPRRGDLSARPPAARPAVRDLEHPALRDSRRRGFSSRSPRSGST